MGHYIWWVGGGGGMAIPKNHAQQKRLKKMVSGVYMGKIIDTVFDPKKTILHELLPAKKIHIKPISQVRSRKLPNPNSKN